MYYDNKNYEYQMKLSVKFAEYEFRFNNKVLFLTLTIMLVLMYTRALILFILDEFSSVFVSLISSLKGLDDQASLTVFNDFLDSSAFNAVLSLFCQLVMLIVPAIVAARLMCRDGKKLAPIKPAVPDKPISYILITMGLCYCLNMLFSLITQHFNGTEEAVIDSLSTVISVVIIAPIFEEILFRGALLQPMLPYNRGYALFIVSVTFGIMHRQPTLIVNALLFGFLIGIGFIKTQSLFICIAVHAINNALAYLSQLFLGDKMTILFLPLIIIYIFSALGFAILFIIDTFMLKKKSALALPAEQSDKYRLPTRRYISIILSCPFMWIFICAFVATMML